MTEKQIALRKLQRTLVNGERLAIHEYVENHFGKTCYCAVGLLMKECHIDMTPLINDDFLNTRAISYSYLANQVNALIEKGFTLDELEELQTLNDTKKPSDLLDYVNKLLAESY